MSRHSKGSDWMKATTTMLVVVATAWTTVHSGTMSTTLDRPGCVEISAR